MTSPFRWDDSAYFEHHCGVCHQPLNHPKAKSSCLGLHCEPCSRYHQALFMLNTSQSCMACRSFIDAHRKRHIEIADLLKKLYDWCDVSGSIISISLPEVEPSQQTQAQRVKEAEIDTSSGINAAMRPRIDRNEPKLSKRERKDAKNLAKAASREKVITGKEIEYIHNVLHPKKSEKTEDGPKSDAEMKELEQNLEFNAAVYKHGTQGVVPRSLGKAHNGNLDISLEMLRILKEFKLAGTSIHDNRSKITMGKDFRLFDQMLVDFKELVVEDLIWAEKEVMATRMRKAAFLRWASREGAETVQTRNAQRHWDTREKETLLANDDSYGAAKSFRIGEKTDEDNSTVDRTQNLKGISSHSGESVRFEPGKPDTRHLHQDGVVVHKTLSSEIQSMRRPNESEVPSHDCPNPTVPFKVLNITNSSRLNGPLEKHTAMISKQTFAKLDGHGLNHVIDTDIYQPVQDPVDEISGLRTTLNPTSSPVVSLQGTQEHINTSDLVENLASNLTIDASAPVPRTTQRASSPKRGRAESSSPLRLSRTPPPTLFSSKKIRKRQRGTAKKIRRRVDLQQTDTQTARIVELLGPHAATGSSIERSSIEKGAETSESSTEKPILGAGTGTDPSKDVHDHAKQPDASEDSKPHCAAKSPTPHSFVPIKASSDHIPGAQLLQDLRKWRDGVNKRAPKADHQPCPTFYSTETDSDDSNPAADSDELLSSPDSNWRAFSSYLEVDDLSPPLAHAHCPFATRNLKNCPYHSADLDLSIAKSVVLISPDNVEPLVQGPLLRIRGEKLMMLYQKHFPEMSRRIMLAYEDIARWLFPRTGHPVPPPLQLLSERIVAASGGRIGPYMKQEQEYNTIYSRNSTTKRKLTNVEFRAMNDKLEPPTGTYFCYCNGPDPAKVNSSTGKDSSDDPNVIECNFRGCFVGRFHAECVNHLSPYTLTKFYCQECQVRMTALAKDMCSGLGLKANIKVTRRSR